MNGRVVHFEIPYDDKDRACRFYGEAFGWELATWGKGEYTLVGTGPTGESGPTEPGFINGGLMQRGDPVRGPVVTIAVEDVEEALSRVEELGGARVVDKQAVGDMGFAAYFRDSEGNLIGLFQPTMGG